MIIVHSGSRTVGLLADRVLDIVSLEASQIQPVPRIARGARVDFLSGLATVDNAMIAVIDLPNLLALQVAADGENPGTEPKSALSAQRR